MEKPIIYQNEDTLGGIPVFYGTRVPIQNLMDYLTTGETIDAFLEDFPSVTREQVLAFLKLAQKQAVAHPYEDSH